MKVILFYTKQYVEKNKRSRILMKSVEVKRNKLVRLSTLILNPKENKAMI